MKCFNSHDGNIIMATPIALPGTQTIDHHAGGGYTGIRIGGRTIRPRTICPKINTLKNPNLTYNNLTFEGYDFIVSRTPRGFLHRV